MPTCFGSRLRIGHADAVEAERARLVYQFSLQRRTHESPVRVRVPDAVRRSPGDAQHRPVRCSAEPGPTRPQARMGPGSAAHRKGPRKAQPSALRSIRGTRPVMVRSRGPHKSATPARPPAIRSAADGTTGGISPARTTLLPRRPRPMARRPDNRSPKDAPRRRGPRS